MASTPRRARPDCGSIPAMGLSKIATEQLPSFWSSRGESVDRASSNHRRRFDHATSPYRKAPDARAIDLLEEWIRQGAEYEKHWSFMPPRLVEPPLAEMTDEKEKPPIDRFIRDKLREKKLTPSPQASPETLVRRQSLDLTGLPPTLEELERFLDQYRRDPVRLTRIVSSASWQVPTLASVWDVGGWIKLVNGPTAMDTQSMHRVKFGSTAIGDIDALNRDIPFDHLPSNKSPVIFLKKPRRTKRSPPVFIAIRRSIKKGNRQGTISHRHVLRSRRHHGTVWFGNDHWLCAMP